MGIIDNIFGRNKKLKQEPEKVVMMNPNDIWFTTPTISNEFPHTIPKTRETKWDVFITEDDYRQNEFLNVSALPQIQEEFNSIKEISTNYSKKSCEYTLFKNCHVRKTIGTPNLTIDFQELKNLLKCNATGQVVTNGEVLLNGFAIKSDNTTYFGILRDGIVIELCIAQWNDQTTKEILEINKTFNLVFVSWYNCDLIRND